MYRLFSIKEIDDLREEKTENKKRLPMVTKTRCQELLKVLNLVRSCKIFLLDGKNINCMIADGCPLSDRKRY